MNVIIEFFQKIYGVSHNEPMFLNNIFQTNQQYIELNNNITNDIHTYEIKQMFLSIVVVFIWYNFL